MSIGYDLAGIQSEPMDRFISRLADFSSDPEFAALLETADRFLASPKAARFFDAPGRELRKTLSQVPSRISGSVTLSTMHGCPPQEIEQICAYLLTRKKLNTYVKLNPTLLGYDRVKRTLESLGFGYVDLKRESFFKDLQMDDAIPMIRRLRKTAETSGRFFGLKLSNTLGTRNAGELLPGDEKYMSGRGLYPLTIGLAAILSGEFNGTLPISYAGGASQHTVRGIAESGIRPITVATDLLKPGGYARLSGMAGIIDSIGHPLPAAVDRDAVRGLSESSLSDPHCSKFWRGFDRISVDKPLPKLDCAVAPCMAACPIGQDAPEYIRLLSQKKYAEALALIYTKNPLPHITGYICDHQCMGNCTRLDYEGSVQIREMKRIAAEKGYLEYISLTDTPPRAAVKVAVIGAGPSGLSCAYFLRKTGVQVTIFEREEEAGGVVSNLLPSYRIPVKAIEKDIAFLASVGIMFKFGVPEPPRARDLLDQGYAAVYVAVGAYKEKTINLGAENPRIFGVLDFLRKSRENPASVPLGKRVAVIGGGNSAMDAARSALRAPGVERVYLVYRRTEQELPADREEFDRARGEGAVFVPLCAPERFTGGGVLVCRKMTLGNPGADGRREPVPSEETVDIPVDSVITAVGEEADTAVLNAIGIETLPSGRIMTRSGSFQTSMDRVYAGGDVRTGPASVVRAIADGRGAAEEIASLITGRDGKAGIQSLFKSAGPKVKNKPPVSELMRKRDKLFLSLATAVSPDFIVQEEARCLHCDTVCNKCVDVCPNRANVAVSCEEGPFKDHFQILHIDDLCNECGNCATFCPYEGRPYRDKLTLFSTEKALLESENDGGWFPDPAMPCVKLRLSGEIYLLDLSSTALKSQPGLDYTELEKASWMFARIHKSCHYLIPPVNGSPPQSDGGGSGKEER
jgi:putative selenate reductase